MIAPSQHERAAAFHALHRPGNIVVLANAWDAASARTFELAGFPALGTTSAGVAWALGYPDKQRLGRSELADAVERICRAVAVPVSVDVEAGFGGTIVDVRDTVRAVIDAGGIGINIEDGREATGALVPAATLVEKIAAIRALADEVGLRLFVNARTDTYLLPAADRAARFEDTVRRLTAYAEAGANGVFVPGVTDVDEIARLVQRVPRPLNVYAGRGVPSVQELAQVGVRRVSVGCGPMQAVLALTRRIASELLTAGTYTAMTDAALSYAEANAMFAGRGHA